MTIRLASGAFLSGPAIKASYPMSMLGFGGGPFPSSDLVVLEQSGTTGGLGSGGSVRCIMKSNGAKVAADAVVGFGAAEAGGSGSGDWSTTVMRLLAGAFASASSRSGWFNSATAFTDTFTITNPAITSHNQLKISSGSIADTQLAEMHFYDRALTNADITAILGGTLPETLSGWIDGWTLKDYQPSGTYTSISGTRTLTATGTISAGTLAHPFARTSPATAVTMTGPASGTVGSPSTNFTVGANGAISGTVTVTPSDGGAGGSFTPTSVNISSGTPTATFTYTASSSGAKTISATNTGGLTNPSNLTYTATAGAATATTLSGPTTGSVGVASTNFTVGANGAITGTVVVTPSDGGAGGSFTPSTVSISNGTPTATFTYTAASSGAKTISTTNNGGLTNPSSITYTASVPAATAVTMTGPSSGAVGSPSTNFLIGANGSITGTIVVTPSDGGGGGSFTPTSVSISAGTPTATFTYTAASAGAKTISVTNNGGLTNPSNITYTASVAAGVFTSGSLARKNGAAVVSVTLTWLKLVNRSTGADVALKTGVTVNSSGIFSTSDAGLTVGTTYVAFWRESTGQYGWGEAVAT